MRVKHYLVIPVSVPSPNNRSELFVGNRQLSTLRHLLAILIDSPLILCLSLWNQSCAPRRTELEGIVKGNSGEGEELLQIIGNTI